MVDREQRSVRRLAGQQEFSAGSRLHLRRHRARTTGTPLMVTGIRLTVIRHTDTQAMDTEPTLRPAMGIRDIPVLPHMLVPRAMSTRAELGSRITPVSPATGIPATRNIPLTSIRRAMNTKGPIRVILLTQVRRATNTKPIKVTLLSQVRRAMNTKVPIKVIPLSQVRRATITNPIKVILLSQTLQAMDYRAIWDALLTLKSSLTVIRTARFILPTLVPAMDLLRTDTPVIAHPRTGLLGSGMVRSLPAEFPLDALVCERGTITRQNRGR